MMQKQQQTNQMKVMTNANAGNTASSLPPINGGTGTLNQQKLPDPKAGRTVLPSGNSTMTSANASSNNNNSTQKKRKKYRMNYAQQVKFCLCLLYCNQYSLIFFLLL